MVEHSRYNISADGADIGKDGILKNKLNIESQDPLTDAEAMLLDDAYNHFFNLLKTEKLIFDTTLIFLIHGYLFSTLYTWAGTIRSVDISKAGILFAPVRHIEKALSEYDDILQQHIPAEADPKAEAAMSLAIIHNEFNAIHPFRDGNGRTIRLFLDLVSASLGYHTIDWDKKSHKSYLQACVRGMIQDHELMAKIIYAGLKKL